MDTMTPPPLYSLLYSCDPAVLPSPIPTVDEIESTALNLPSIRDPRYGGVVRIRNDFVVKYGIHVNENEGHALLLLEKHPSIHTPRLYAMFRHADRLYLILSFEPGEQLSKLWDELSEAEKSSITGQLRTVWDRLRAIPSPGLFGSVKGGPVPHHFFWWDVPEPRINGPFSKEEDFSLAFGLRSRKDRESHQPRPWMSEFLERTLPVALKGHDSVFTHGGLQRKNILVEQLPGDDGGGERRFKVGAILDWESAGWYPSYWEYANCFAHFVWNDDWPEQVERILDPFPLEAAMLRVVRQEIDY